VLKDVFLYRVYTPSGFEIEDDSIVLDIGAHVGAFAASAARAARGVRVFAFEPSPENFELLSSNMTRNCLSNVHLSQCAVSGVTGPQRLHFSGSPAEHSLHIVKPGVAHISVPSVTLAHILRTHAIGIVDLLKMDCEGAEYEILETTPADTLSRVRRIALEAHLLDRSRTPGRIRALLEAQGFAVRTRITGDVRAMMWASRPSH
jgi:FkbM family methyltransferase